MDDTIEHSIDIGSYVIIENYKIFLLYKDHLILYHNRFNSNMFGILMDIEPEEHIVKIKKGDKQYYSNIIYYSFSSLYIDKVYSVKETVKWRLEKNV